MQQWAGEPLERKARPNHFGRSWGVLRAPHLWPVGRADDSKGRQVRQTVLADQRHGDAGRVRVLVVPTNEEIEIAQQTLECTR